MKKTLSSILVLSLIIMGVSTYAETIEKEKGYISVNKSVIKEVPPNQVEITVGIETSDKELQKASDDNKVIANNVYNALKALLGPNDYVKTGEYSAKTLYSYTKENKRVFDKYVVTNKVVVKTKNVQLVSKLVDTAVAKGATNISNLAFTTTDYEASCNEALSELTKKASAQATSVAGSIGAKIVGVKSIITSCNTDSSPRPYYAMVMKDAVNEAASTPIESGKIQINASIDASFYVK